MRKNKVIIVSATIALQLVIIATVCISTHASDRSEDIKKQMEAIDGQDQISATVAADEALKSEDPLLRSMVLEKILSHKNPRVRSVGFIYLVNTQKRIVIECTASESSLAAIQVAGDRSWLLGELVLVVEFSKYDPKTTRFEAEIDKWGRGEGAIGQDGITVTAHKQKFNLAIASNGYLTGTASYKLSNTPGLITLPAKSALP